MSKIRIMLFIIAFWLIIPLPFMILGIGGFDRVSFKEIQDLEQPSFFNYLTIGWDYLSIYFRIIFIGFYGTPIYIDIFLWLLRAITVFTFILVIRGI